MWIPKERWQGQEVLDWVDLDDGIWVEIPDLERKGGADVQSKNRAEAGKEAVSFENELCELGAKKVHDRHSAGSSR